jgi:hypothetical protein
MILITAVASSFAMYFWKKVNIFTSCAREAFRAFRVFSLFPQ